MEITANTQLCIIIGDPINHSLSPQMHNAAYRALGIADKFVHVAARVPLSDLAQAVRAVRILNIRGLTCTMPHKQAVLAYLDTVDETATSIGAANSIVNDQGKLCGYNTDWIGAITALEKHTSLAKKRVAVFGAGGAAHAIVYGLVKKHADVTLYNRTPKQAHILANLFGTQVGSLTHLAELRDHDIIINTTSVGMYPALSETPVPQEYIASHHLVFDIVNAPRETRLLREAKEKGATVIYGTDMLLYEAAAKFTLYTGYTAPVETMRQVLNHL